MELLYQSHDLLKKTIEQALLLRGSRDFPHQSAYMVFVEEVVKSRNVYRKERLLLEMNKLKSLPDDKWHAPTILQVRVSSGSIVQIFSIPYTVPSRLIHYTLKAYVYQDEIILFYRIESLSIR